DGASADCVSRPLDRSSTRRLAAKLTRRGDHRADFRCRSLPGIHRPARERAEAAIGIQEDLAGRVEAKRVLYGRANGGGRFHGVGPRVDHAQAQLLAAERQEIAGAIGRVLEHELRDIEAREIRRQRLIAAAEQRRFIATPVAPAYVHAETTLLSGGYQ